MLQPLYDDSVLHPGLLHRAVPLAERPQPPLLDNLVSSLATVYSMHVVRFNLPDKNKPVDTRMKKCRKRSRETGDVLDDLRESVERRARPHSGISATTRASVHGSPHVRQFPPLLAFLTPTTRIYLHRTTLTSAASCRTFPSPATLPHRGT